MTPTHSRVHSPGQLSFSCSFPQHPNIFVSLRILPAAGLGSIVAALGMDGVKAKECQHVQHAALDRVSRHVVVMLHDPEQRGGQSDQLKLST
eukprot:27387-Chlamydomonas_euryale.AAC.10